MKLVLCPHCSRHVRLDEVACPFCAGSMEGVEARGVSGPALTRAAVVFVGATALAACGKESGPPVPEPVAVYGPAPVENVQPAPDAGAKRGDAG